MHEFFKTKRGKVITLVTALVLLIAGLGMWKYLQNMRDQKVLAMQVNQPITERVNKATMRNDNIHQLTNDELLRYRKEGLRQHVDRYPNGYLRIPSLGIKLPIYNRANHLTLSWGVGKTYYLDSQMGKGNFVVAGHNMEVPHVLLSDLHKIHNNADIQLIDKNKTYHYHVISKRVTSPYVTLVNNQPIKGSAYYMPKGSEKPLVTVYTCANHGQKRFVVQGVLDN